MKKKRTSEARDLYGSAPDKCDTAILVIDVINDFCFPEAQQLMEHAVPMARRLKSFCARARKSKVPVIYVNDNFGRWQSDFKSIIDYCLKSPGKDVVKQLIPKKRDYFVLKPKHSGFHQTTLEILLTRLGAKRLIITGIASNICVLFTANDAYMRDFKVKVPSDCVVANTATENSNALNEMKRILKADTAPSTRLKFRCS